jgi:guanine deaminase
MKPAGADTLMPKVFRAPLCNPRPDGGVDYLPDAALAADKNGRITFVGDWQQFERQYGREVEHERLTGLLVPGMLDLHTHVPQHPIRGHFMDGVDADDPRGVLLAGLERNVFPAERTWESPAHAVAVARRFAEDALHNGVVGGCAFLTIHADAAEQVLGLLPPTWHAGMVLMDQNCPPYLRNDEHAIEEVARLASQFGQRFVMTDRFAVANSTAQRHPAAKIARERGLLTQTHLNEQVLEKRLVEQTLYPHARSYTDVYLDDGWLDSRAVLAHCVQMTPPEWDVLAAKRCVIAHCPTSNARLASGVMDLNAAVAYGIDYAICTDVGASGTTSLLAEMAMFLLVHRGRSNHATACEALYRTTLAPARVLGLDDCLGRFEVGKEMCFVELTPPPEGATDAETVLQAAFLPESLRQRLPTCFTEAPAPIADVLRTAAATNATLTTHESTVRQVVWLRRQ